MSDDHSADIHTTGTIEVGGTATGEIEEKRDKDWFAVELVGGRTYVVHVEGSPTGAGTLANTVLRGIYDSDGAFIAGTRNNNGGEGANALKIFTPTENGTYYIGAKGRYQETGTYTVSVLDVTPSLGDVTYTEPGEESVTLDGGADDIAYRKFILAAERTVSIDVTGLDAEADVVLEDAAGAAIESSRESGTNDESITATLAAGTYYVRIEAQAAGANTVEVHYAAAEPVTEYTAEELAALGLSSNEDDFSEGPGLAGDRRGGHTGQGQRRSQRRPGLVRGDARGRQGLPHRSQGRAERRRDTEGHVPVRRARRAREGDRRDHQ